MISREIANSTLFGALICAVIVPVYAITPSATGTVDRAINGNLLANLPLSFEINKGQVNPAVNYMARGAGYQLFLTAQEAVITLDEPTKLGLNNMVGQISSMVKSDDDGKEADIRMRFYGANPAPHIEGRQEQDTRTNYFYGSESVQQFTNIVSYSQVKYNSIYPGIDLVYYGNQGELEYDLLVEAHADPRTIQIGFEGAEKITLSKDGDVVLYTTSGELVFRRPIAYQIEDGIRSSIEAKYVLNDNGKIGFRLGQYDTTKPLVIDPILSYSSFLWGSNATGVAVDDAGNAYVVGYINTKDLPVVGGYKTTLAGYQDAYVLKIDPTGTRLIYATYLGSRRSTTFGYGISVDIDGNAYVIGKTDSSAFPVTPGAYQTNYSPGASFVTKLNAAGNSLLYSTYINGASIASIAADSTGNAYFTGKASAISTTPDSYQPLKASSIAPFVAKLSSSGNAMVYATYLGGSGLDESRAIAVDASGNAYVAGVARSIDFPLNNAYQSYLRGAEDAFVTKLDPTGAALIYSTYLGGSERDNASGISVDLQGNAYVVGKTFSSNFPVTADAFQRLKGYPDPAVSNAFITKLGDNGKVLVYSSFLGGRWCLTTGVYSCVGFYSDGIDAATAVAVDEAGYAYIGGFATSVGFPQEDPIQKISPGGDEWRTPFVAKISPSGDRKVYSVVLGARGQDEYLGGLAVDKHGSAYAVGNNSYAKSDFPITANPLKATGGMFIFKLSTGKYPTIINSSSNPASSTQQITFSASVLSTQLGGIVSFMDGANLLGSAPVIDGMASITTTLPIGIYMISAVYSEDGLVSPVYIQIVDGN